VTPSFVLALLLGMADGGVAPGPLAPVATTDAGPVTPPPPAPAQTEPVAPVAPPASSAPPPPAPPSPSPPAAEVKVLVRGVVLARGSRDPVVQASILVDAKDAGETDEAGRFSIEVAPGKHRLQVQAPGFDPADVPLSLHDRSLEASLTVRLQPRLSGERYETVVSAPALAAVALEQDDLTHTAGSMGEPFRVIESLPGVAQVAWPLSLYAIRGANPGNTGFFLDGVRLPALFHFALGPAVIHPYFLDRLEFYPGGYPAQYGRFVSGVVAASTAAPKPDRVRGSADVRLFDAGAIVATPFNEGRGTVAIGGRYSYTGLLFSMLSPDYTLSYWDYQGRVDHALGPGRITLFAFGSSDVLGNKSYMDTNAQIRFHRLDLRWQGKVGPGRLVVGNALGLDESAVSLDPVVRLPIRIKTRSAAPRLAYLVSGEKLDWEIGSDAEAQWLRPRTDREDTEGHDLFADRLALAAGAYTSVTWRPTADVQIAPGVRYDVFFEADARKVEPGPRLSVRFRPIGDTWLKAQVGRFAQMASLPVAVPGFESFGLSTLGTQTSKQASAGVEQGLGQALSLDVTGFYQRLLLTDLLSVFNYDPADPRLLELRDGESYGVEVMLRRSQSRSFYGWLAYTLSWSQRLVGPSKAKAFSDWDQRHVLNLVTGLRFRGGYSLGGRFHVNTGRPYPVFDDDNPGPPDYTRLPTFYQLDLRADKRFVFDKYVLDVYIEAVNTTLTRQVFDIKRTGGVVEEKAYKIVLPSLGVHAEW
jgi:hypothetical protein